MISKSRKLTTGAITFLIVLGIFLIYSHFSDTPNIQVTKRAGTQKATDTDSKEDIGKISQGIGVGTWDKARFIDLDPITKEVAREWGFEKLLHQKDQEWEIDEPYMNIYRNDFECYITADTGIITFESGVTRPMTKRAAFSGNVVIHIEPKGQKPMQKSDIYFDDLTFDSDRSMFSTPGPIKFVSERALLTGRGLEFIYDQEENRIVLVRIFQLESLKLKTEQNVELFSNTKTTDNTNIAKANDDAVSQPKTRRITKEELKTKPAEIKTDPKPEVETEPQISTPDKKTNLKPKEKNEQRYRCLLSKNVVIDAPEQLVIAFDEFVINDIIGNALSGQPQKQNAETTENEKTVAKKPDVKKTTVKKPEVKKADAEKKIIQDVPVVDIETEKQYAQTTKTEPEIKFVDIIITCDDGITVTPMDSTAKYTSSMHVIEKQQTSLEYLLSLKQKSQRTTFVADKIDYFYDASGDIGDIIANGNSELIFYVEQQTENDPNVSRVPVVVTAKKKTMFLPGQNTAVFIGGCVAKMVNKEGNVEQKQIISAPKFTVVLDEQRDPDSALPGLKRFTASGGVVRLSSVKTTADQLLAGVELKCNQFDYDPINKLFTATGPGIITVDNSKMPKPKPGQKVGQFSLQKPCWAFVRDFQTLSYFFETNEIIANAKPYETLRIDYFPIENGEYGPQVTSTANQMTAKIVETPDGKNEISTFHAKGGVTYEEEARKNIWGKGKEVQFVGSDFIYNVKKGQIQAWGNQDNPCLLNGTLVDGIEYNVENQSIRTTMVGPGILQ
ncbi:MAG: hypothetical protein FVQ80_03020 [Planctomycetes bacterium]|nr:hypothetical protein [Planctomycetota bacterium]